MNGREICYSQSEFTIFKTRNCDDSKRFEFLGHFIESKVVFIASY